MTATSLVAVFREQVDLRRIFLDDPARHEKGQPQLAAHCRVRPRFVADSPLESGGFEPTVPLHALNADELEAAGSLMRTW